MSLHNRSTVASCMNNTGSPIYALTSWDTRKPSNHPRHGSFHDAISDAICLCLPGPHLASCCSGRRSAHQCSKAWEELLKSHARRYIAYCATPRKVLHPCQKSCQMLPSKSVRRSLKKHR
eukprot:6468875-Amphidinium_carterae.2